MPDSLFVPVALVAFNLIAIGILYWRLQRTASSEISAAKFDSILRNSETTIREEGRHNREEASKSARQLREEVQNQMNGLFENTKNLFETLKQNQDEQLEKFGQTLSLRLSEVSKEQKLLTESLDTKQDALREKLDLKMKELREENSKKLEEMRNTVDEKLQSSLEKRFKESFAHVSERLEAVHKGLGEMTDLAGSVGDLKRTLTNVKTRGTWAEVQLSKLLEDYLTPDQYEANAQIKKGSQQRVEFAVRLPGTTEDAPVLLAIDSKFPTEAYDRLNTAIESADPVAIKGATKALSDAVKVAAKSIQEKYIDPPNTTDFALMFLPTEGLYAEVIRQPGLVQKVQSENRIAIVGPHTLAAFLSSLQLGFRTLAVEKRSSEVWQLLGAVKTEFGKFGDVLGKVRKKIQEAGNQLDGIDTRTRVINRKMKGVAALPDSDSSQLLDLSSELLSDDPEEDSGDQPLP